MFYQNDKICPAASISQNFDSRETCDVYDSFSSRWQFPDRHWPYHALSFSGGRISGEGHSLCFCNGGALYADADSGAGV